MNAVDFEQLGFKFIKCGNVKPSTKTRRFVAFFGAVPEHVAILWWELSNSGWFNFSPTRRVKPVHLLMGLHFLRGYHIEEENASFFDCDEKTFRQWSWFIIKGIAKLDRKWVSLVSCCHCCSLLVSNIFLF